MRIRHLCAGAAALLAFAATAGTSAAAAPGTDPVAGVHIVESAVDHACLTEQVQARKCGDAGLEVFWRFTPVGNGMYTLESRHGARCLSERNGALSLQGCGRRPTPYAQWSVTAQPGGAYTIHHPYRVNRHKVVEACLTRGLGASVGIAPCNPIAPVVSLTQRQNWYLGY